LIVDYDFFTFWDAYSVAEDIRLAVEENPGKESFEKYFFCPEKKSAAYLKLLPVGLYCINLLKIDT
jgi:hypothetical protein